MAGLRVLLLLALAAASSPLLASTSAAQARSSLDGVGPVERTSALSRPWPGDRIRYLDRTSAPVAVHRAVAAWNASGIDVRFVKVRRTSRAQLVIRDYDHVCGFGIATTGYTPGSMAQAKIAVEDANGEPCAWPEVTLKTVHELGHVLGLGHVPESTCAIMNPSTLEGVAPSGCIAEEDDADVATWWCRMLSAVDLTKARRLYGGVVRERSPEWCDSYPRIVQSGPITATGTTRSNALTITATRVLDTTVPAWALEDGVQSTGVLIRAANDGCPTSPDPTDASVLWWDDVSVGGSRTDMTFWSGPTVPGQTCVAAWQFDTAGTYAALPSTTIVQEAPPG
ncbi:hypothetical protein [Nocardioides sp.]|uniref:hypothetical protein n=1 Tax=Nocardioides sp. TaxID=35761 RepID=UPI00286E138E|nr:hypothetical protein [Nocardioides sp.]